MIALGGKAFDNVKSFINDLDEEKKPSVMKLVHNSLATLYPDIKVRDWLIKNFNYVRSDII